MESFAGGDGGGIGVDCGVGTIVWVRRRNGSWWPGRILGLDELSASHLMSPRSGTPVKLLGREDASVDWYNLEKSKRVKAFRCGEFDACIERAEASHCTPIKKREKYARREDAILHALELEKQQQLGSGSYRSEPSNICSPESYMKHDEHAIHRNLSLHKPQILLTKSDFSQEEEELNNSSYANNRSNKQFRREEDNPEALPRMRGLQDFGLQTAQSKRKLRQFVNWKDAVHASSSKNSVSVKRKRSQSRLDEESFMKKRDRRRTLVQVLQSSAKFASLSSQCSYDDVEKSKMPSICRAKRSKCVYLPQDSDETPEHDSEPVLANQFGTCKSLDNPVDVVEGYVSSGSIEANDSDSSEADYLEDNMGEVANMSTDKAHALLPGSKVCESPKFQISEKLRRLNDDEISHSELISQLQEHITDPSAEVGVSKWHMKGKRNTRNIGKRPMDAGDGKIYSAANCNGSMNETACENKVSSLNLEIADLSNVRALSWGLYPKRESFYNCDEGDLINKDLAEDQLNIYDDWRNPVSLPTIGGDRRSQSSLSLNDSDEPSNLTHSTLWEEPVEHFRPETEPFLVDVELKVEASYQGEHVPLVSLMSRLNGKAIIGHPVPIEILESCSTIHLVSKLDAVTDETAAPSPMWRTGRRTAMQRVPRVNPLTTSRTHQSQSKKVQKKNSKRISFTNQKTRTLSSFASSDKLGDESCSLKLTGSSDILEGLIKPEGFVPLVACVPVKVVFSRLLEAVGKPSSAAVRRIRSSSTAIRGLSYQLSRV